MLLQTNKNKEALEDIPEDVVSEAAVEAAAVDRSAAEMTELDAGNAGKTGLAASKLKRRPLIHMKTEEL